jgi:hypothetical protein
MTRLARLLPFAIAATILCGSVDGFAQDLLARRAELLDGKPALEKVASQLLDLRLRARDGATARELEQSASGLQISGTAVQIEVRFRRLTPWRVARLTALGMQVLTSYVQYGRVYGSCDLADLDRIARVPGVYAIYPLYPSLHNAGAVTSQGDSAILANLARSTFGVDGTGVRVGVISDSFVDQATSGTISGSGCSRTVSGMPDQLSGDLPPLVDLVNLGPGNGTDEGRAMGEIIHDLSPGAEISFSSSTPAAGGDAEASVATSINDLVPSSAAQT